MFNRLLFTIATVSCLTGVYAVYAVVTRPLVIVPELPATVDTTTHTVVHRPAENVRVAQTYLPELRWAAESPYMLRAGQSFIYTRKFEHEAGDPRIRFIPFAMVWVQKDKDGRESAVSLVSDSALLKFASGFDEANPNPGRVVGAVLDGEVQVKGSDGLAIAGKQFVFDESAPSLISTNLVRFQYGSHRGQGRSLNVKLIPAEGPPGRDRPHVFGIRTIRLASGNDPATKKFEPVQLDVRMPQQDQEKLVKIRCSGDLEYDVANHTALFSKSVRADSKTNTGGYDSLDCDKLWLKFEPVRSKIAAINPTQDENGETKPRSYQQIETDLEFRQMIAEGKMVKIVSTDRNLRATMNRLVYDAADRRVQLTDPRDVYVSQNGSVLTVPNVDVRLREDNWPEDVLCQGAGRLEVTRPQTNELAFVATWKRQLQLKKSAESISGLNYIELQQQATFGQPQQRTGLGAELIRLWLANAIDNVSGLDMSGTSGKSATSSRSNSPEPQPKRLVAERKVVLVSPQLEALTQELDVQFDPVSAPPREISRLEREGLELVSFEEKPTAQTRKPRVPEPPKLRRQLPKVEPTNFAISRESGSLGPPIDIPSSTDEPLDQLQGKRPNARDPLKVTADRIAVRMQRVEGETEPELAEVETQGHVKVVQRRPAGEAPLTAEGDRLHLQNRGLQRETVHLFGQPAHLRDQRLHVEGREVHLDREANKVWVKGNGLLQLPVPPGTALESLGQESNDPDLDVWWEESMEFDGRTAKFIGKVRAELGLSRMRCEQMDVSLSSRLSFAEPDVNQKPELDTIHCREDVLFENSKYEENKLVSVQRGRVAEFTLERLKGTSFAQGPGQLQVWRRSKGKQAVTTREAIQANRPINSVDTDWDFTRINFKGRMTGNIDRQRSIFHGSVLIVHGPVNLPNETIDADRLPALAGSMRCDTLEYTYVSKGPNQPEDRHQTVGKGNARIEGRGFYANADEISYDGVKGLYMLRAHGNQSALIARDTDKGTRNETSGRRIEFNPETQTVKVDWATGATGTR